MKKFTKLIIVLLLLFSSTCVYAHSIIDLYFSLGFEAAAGIQVEHNYEIGDSFEIGYKIGFATAGGNGLPVTGVQTRYIAVRNPQFLLSLSCSLSSITLFGQINPLDNRVLNFIPALAVGFSDNGTIFSYTIIELGYVLTLLRENDSFYLQTSIGYFPTINFRFGTKPFFMF